MQWALDDDDRLMLVGGSIVCNGPMDDDDRLGLVEGSIE